MGTSRSQKQWIASTQQEVADFFGCSKPTIYLWGKQGMPGRRSYYDLSAIYHWKHSRNDLSAGSDPLDMQRLEKAKILRLDRMQKERELVSVASIHGVLTEFARHLRELGEYCQRDYGDAIVVLFNEKIDDAIAELERAENDSEDP